MKRWLVRICVFLLLLGGGAIVNVAVAWSIAACVKPNVATSFLGAELQQDEQLYLVVSTSTSPGTVFAVSEWRTVADDTDRKRIPAWLRRASQSERRHSAHDRIIYAVGWPAKAMWCAHALSYVSGPMYHAHFDGAITIPLRPWDVSFGRLDRVFPYRVIFAGFAINTVFYGAILWVLFAVSFALQSRRRIRRGLCPKCAYDLRGTPEATACPECGAVIMGNR